VISWNARGLPLHKLLDGAGSLLASVDIFGVWDTWNNDALIQVVDSHVVRHTDIPTGAKKVSGQGGAIGISKRIAAHIQFRGWHPHIPLGWVKLPACYIGFVYARHGMVADASSRADFMAHLHADVAQKQNECPVILMGDINAQFGPEMDACNSPRLTLGVACSMGKLVMDMARRCDLVTTTGRLDNHEVTWEQVDTQGRIRASTRIDHVMVQSDIWPSVLECTVLKHKYGSDHHPLHLVMDLALSCCGARRQPNHASPFLRWNYSKHAQYVTWLMHQTPMWNQLHTATQQGQVGLATVLVNSLVWAAASKAGMVIDPKTAQNRQKCMELSLPPEALQLQSRMRQYRLLHVEVPRDLHAQWRKFVKDACKQRDMIMYTHLTQDLRDRPRKFWKQWKRRSKPPDALISTESWRDYGCMMFGQVLLDHVEQEHTQSHDRTDMQEIMDDVTEEEVVQVFQKLATAKACGLDRLPAEFLTKAASLVPGTPGTCTYHFAMPLAKMFSTVMQTCTMPREWKIKCIHPIHKKYDIHNPANYRLLGVSTTMYTLFTGVLSNRTMPFTAPSHPRPLLSDNQFAFRRELGVEHAHMPIITAIDIAFARKEPIVLLKLDIAKAYDTVKRHMLWQALREEGLPARFIQMMQELYTDAYYHIACNGGHADAFLSTVGLLQGCRLSPIMYSIFLKKAIDRINSTCSIWGLMIGNVSFCHTNFADDITAALTAIAFIAFFMDKAETILHEKGQALNRPKCQGLVINYDSDAHGPLPDTIAGVKIVGSMKTLGLMYDSGGSLAENIDSRASKARSKNALAFARMASIGYMHDLHINLLLHSADIRPTLLFGAALWGSHSLRLDPIQHPLQPTFSVLLRQAFGLPASTAHWIAMQMSGQLPVQLLVILEFCRFWNRLVHVAEHNPVIQACLYAQTQMARLGRRCWLKGWIDALHRVQPTLLQQAGDLTQWPAVMMSPVKQLTGCATLAYESMLESYGDPMSVGQCQHRKIALHFRCFWHGKWGHKPWYVWVNMPEKTWKAWVQLVSCNANVPAQTLVRSRNEPDGREYAQRLCKKCTRGAVASEQHVLLECPATSTVRNTFRIRLSWPQPLNLATFLDKNQHFVCAVFAQVAVHVYNARPEVG
jgi:Reverse transcriptase (RNA-dependent DNA polymerase)